MSFRIIKLYSEYKLPPAPSHTVTRCVDILVAAARGSVGRDIDRVSRAEIH